MVQVKYKYSFSVETVKVLQISFHTDKCMFTAQIQQVLVGCESTELNVFLCHSGFVTSDNVKGSFWARIFPLHKVGGETLCLLYESQQRDKYHHTHCAHSHTYCRDSAAYLWKTHTHKKCSLPI